LVLGQFGIVARAGGYLDSRNFDMMRTKTTRFLEEGVSFAIYRVDAPYKPVTRHGTGKKLGGGKGSIRHYATPIKAGRVIMEVGGKLLWDEVRPWLSLMADNMPFPAIAVTADMLQRLREEEERLEEVNMNPYSFEWLVRNNMFDCQQHLSPRDKKLFGKFMYRDRTMNLKWNSVLRTKRRYK